MFYAIATEEGIVAPNLVGSDLMPPAHFVRLQEGGCGIGEILLWRINPIPITVIGKLFPVSRIPCGGEEQIAFLETANKESQGCLGFTLYGIFQEFFKAGYAFRKSEEGRYFRL
jgi:hypothetical protein